jgi:hypothetical protein
MAAPPKRGRGPAVKEIDKIALRRWRKRGFYSESVLVKVLQKTATTPSASRQQPKPQPPPRHHGPQRRPTASPSKSKMPHTTPTSPNNKSTNSIRFLNEPRPHRQSRQARGGGGASGQEVDVSRNQLGRLEKDKLPEKVRILKRDRETLPRQTVELNVRECT